VRRERLEILRMNPSARDLRAGALLAPVAGIVVAGRTRVAWRPQDPVKYFLVIREKGPRIARRGCRTETRSGPSRPQALPSSPWNQGRAPALGASGTRVLSERPCAWAHLTLTRSPTTGAMTRRHHVITRSDTGPSRARTPTAPSVVQRTAPPHTRCARGSEAGDRVSKVFVTRARPAAIGVVNVSSCAPGGYSRRLAPSLQPNS
jgi:hypothetical protein